MCQFELPITGEDKLVFQKKGSKIVVHIMIDGKKELKVGTITREVWPLMDKIDGRCVVPGYYNSVIRLEFDEVNQHGKKTIHNLIE